MADDDDPIVCEIPVHLSEHLRKNLYVAQFPLRPAYRPMPNAPRAARLKPEHQILQLDYSVDQRSVHFDSDAEEHLKQKTLRLQSTCVPPLTNYAIGVFRDGQLHLTPVTAIVQMRPSLAHIDAAAGEEEDDMDTTPDNLNGKSQKEPQEAENKEVQFQFKKKQSERQLSAIQNSYAYHKQKINAESWKELSVCDKENAATETEFEHLFSEREEDVISPMTPEEYLQALRYRSVEESSKGEKMDIDEDEQEIKQPIITSATHIQVLHRLRTYYIMHFADLQASLPKLTEEEILDALPHVAISIRGRLLPSSVHVCTSEKSQQTRTSILQELSKQAKGVSRTDMVEKYGLDPIETKEILENIATLDPSTRLWSFKLQPDDMFTNTYSAVTKHMKL